MTVALPLALLALSYLPLTPNGGVPSNGFLREAEKKHARVAMLALPTLGAIAAATGDNPLPFLSHQELSVQLAFFGAAGTLEGFTFARLGPEFSLKPGVVPGRYLDVPYVEAAEMAEDGVGRAAMLATAATMVALLPQAVLTA